MQFVMHLYHATGDYQLNLSHGLHDVLQDSYLVSATPSNGQSIHKHPHTCTHFTMDRIDSDFESDFFKDCCGMKCAGFVVFVISGSSPIESHSWPSLRPTVPSVCPS